MDNQRLLEIKNKLSTLPVLQKRLEKLAANLAEAEQELERMTSQYDTEALDVDNLKRDSLYNKILKIMHRYEGRMDREIQEMVQAKLEYDRAVEKLAALKQEKEDLQQRIAELTENQKEYQTELRHREKKIKSTITNEAYVAYQRLEAEQEMHYKQLVEIGEASKCAIAVLETAESALEHLDSAEGWATFDVWARGGILSHMAKYDHIDKAQEDFNRLSHEISRMKKELEDVEMVAHIESIGIDSTTRMFDFWFDNIFTDLNVREKIRADKEEIGALAHSIKDILHKLESKKKELHRSMEKLEQSKNDMLISLD